MALSSRATQKASKRQAKSRSKKHRLAVNPTRKLADIMALIEYSYMIMLKGIYMENRTNRTAFMEKAGRLLLPVMKDMTLVTESTARLWTIYSRANKKSSRAARTKPNTKYVITGGAEPFAPGGPYLQRLTEKGDKPITGYDFAKALDEMMTMMSSLQYTKDFSGRPMFLSDITRGLDWFRGNDWGFKNYVRNYWSQKFYSLYPPSINIGEILSRWDNIVDYLNMYTDDKRIRREYANEMGYPVKETDKDRFLQAFARKYDMADRMFMQTRNKMNLRNLRI
jgi:hypothetical protein